MSFQETEEEVEVRKEDQDRINEFGVIHKTVSELLQEKKAIDEQLQFLEDAEQEVMLSSDDSGTFLIQLGSTYVHVTEDEFNEFLETKKSEYEKKMEELNQELDSLETKKNDLKVTLYARFGKTINLDD